MQKKIKKTYNGGKHIQSTPPVAPIKSPSPQILTANKLPLFLPFLQLPTSQPPEARERKPKSREPPPRDAMEPSAAAASRPPSFTAQTNALLRKNLIFQVRIPLPSSHFFPLRLNCYDLFGTRMSLLCCSDDMPQGKEETARWSVQNFARCFFFQKKEQQNFGLICQFSLFLKCRRQLVLVKSWA